MPVAAEKSDLRAAKKARDTLSDHVAENHDPDQPEEVEECAVRIWRWQQRGTSHDLVGSHRHHQDQKRQADEHKTDCRSLSPSRTAHYFCAAADADIRALGNLRIAVWADEFIHAENIAACCVLGGAVFAFSLPQ